MQQQRGILSPMEGTVDLSDAVKVVDLRVDYGDLTAVEGLSLTIPAGEIFGLVGPNGAGKTSTFKVLATLMEPTYGEVFLCGLDIAEKRSQARRLLGYMPDLAPMPSDLKVWEFLDLFGHCYGLPLTLRQERIDHALNHVVLMDRRNDYCKDLSRGMKQRLALAKALLHRPRLMLLDEPASGMDPVSRSALRRTLQELAKEGSTIIVSSHILTELSAMCTSVGIMSKGQLIASGPIQEVVGQFSAHKTLNVYLLSGLEHAEALLRSHAEVSDLQVQEYDAMLRCQFSGTAESQAALLGQLIGQGCQVRSFSEKAMDIEDILLGLDDNHTGESKPHG